jgi:hypothetical protein
VKKLIALLVVASFLIGCTGGNTTPTGSSAKTADNILPPKGTDPTHPTPGIPEPPAASGNTWSIRTATRL